MKRGKYRPRQSRLTDAQVAEVWARRAGGESVTRIARHMGRYVKSVRTYIHDAGGIRPRPGKRSRVALSLQEREEISRGLAASDSLRVIAARLSRAPSTVGHSMMLSSRPKAPTAVPRSWNYGPSAPSTFTGGSHATRRACKAPYDSRPRPPCSCRDHGSAKQGRGTVTPVGFEGHRDHSPSEGSQDRGIAPNGVARAVIGGLRGHTRRMRRFGFDWRALRRFGAVG